MLDWKFKAHLEHNGEDIIYDSRKFEILVEEYLKKEYPLENWTLTKSTRDGNKDVENICEFSGVTMWAEVKYTIHTDKNLPSRKFDSTLVSSLDTENLIKIFFVTNTSIGQHLIGRIKKFYYLSKVEKIAFIDGNTLAYWIKKHPDVEARFFEVPLKFIVPTSPTVRLNCVRVYCKKDSYTIDSVLENEKVYPLYLANNYILEGDFVAFGFEEQELELYCNKKLIFRDKVPAEIVTFTLEIRDLQEMETSKQELELELYYKFNEKEFLCGNYKLDFISVGRIYKKQFQCYDLIKKGILQSYKKIYNIYGEKSTGKSWVLINLKNDLLNEAKKNQKIIYINFSGNDSDITDICKIIFTLLFDFYNLDISTTMIEKICNSSIQNGFFSHNIINTLIRALKQDNYSEIGSILTGIFPLKAAKLFEIKKCFANERIYFIDNVHLLSKNNYRIFEAIISGFNPLSNTSFVITNRRELINPLVENVPLGCIGESEILSTLNEYSIEKITSTNLILPQKNYLRYPGLLDSFTKDIPSDSDLMMIKEYYINHFQNNAIHYLEGEYKFDNLLLILICIIREGILLESAYQLETSRKIAELLNQKYIVQKSGYLFPNYEKWNKNISQDIIIRYKNQIIDKIMLFMQDDIERNAFYKCTLMNYYPEYYNDFFEDVLKMIKNYFANNMYHQVISLCKTLLVNKDFYVGNAEVFDYIKYYLAFSYMHCDASVNVMSFFQNIVDNYQLKPKNDIYFSAESELIDAKYWSFKYFKELPQEINCFRKEWKVAIEHNINVESRSYLTATNRMMVTYLALDINDKAEQWFRKNLKLAVVLQSPEHIGYTYMDFAKGIYHIDMNLALKYLQIADTYFQEPTEKRRHLDCQCEIQYVKLLLGKGTLTQLLKAQMNLFENQYWIQYYKCNIKLAIYFILQNKCEEACKYLLETEASLILRKDERVKYLCSILNAFLYKKEIAYNNSNIKDTSYQNVINNAKLNTNASKALIYNQANNEIAFYLDPRAW